MEIIVVVVVVLLILVFWISIKVDIALTLYLAKLVGSKKRWVGQLILFVLLLPIFLFFLGG